ncbi:SAM-dependent methyltransferase [Pseudonocardia sp.]|jgi:8-demethyl-8-(2,3,4-trimethoxy-alpha-L-rhamnosyl)tetracenomycin-C O-methyltransferase|uniref:SAM-dependent methyltransferase n=1 Tax=Pseudonocardia sp. TaxID=60912 RepID=UPI00260935BF|nr:SAM-dependent methyltransferase [Pseudonocardia sp.]
MLTTSGRPRVHDQWDITNGVGLTALAVAAARAVEAGRPDALVHDRWAAEFVRAARSVDPSVDFPAGADDVGDDAELWLPMTDYMAVRSRVFDDALLDGVRAARQVVVLAAGLDARALRLPWPSGTTVFEVDQPRVLAFKQEVIDSRGDTSGDRRTVPVDLRDDWSSALLDRGFDPAAPTAWLAEGLLPYLPAEAEKALFETIDRLSAPGSTLAVEAVGEDQVEAIDGHPVVTRSAESLGMDIVALWNREPRTDCTARLRELGWEVATESAGAVAQGLGRPLVGDVAGIMAEGRIIRAGKG